MVGVQQVVGAGVGVEGLAPVVVNTDEASLVDDRKGVHRLGGDHTEHPRARLGHSHLSGETETREKKKKGWGGRRGVETEGRFGVLSQTNQRGYSWSRHKDTQISYNKTSGRAVDTTNLRTEHKNERHVWAKLTQNDEHHLLHSSPSRTVRLLWYRCIHEPY